MDSSNILSTRILQLTQELEKKKKLLRNVQGDLLRAQEAILLEHEANLLKANMHLLKRGMKEVTVVDYTLDPPAKKTIKLDEKQSPQDLVNKIFKHIKRAKRGVNIIENRLQLIRENIEALEKEIANPQEDGLLPTPSVDEKKRKQDVIRQPFHQFFSHDGLKIWVGRSAKDSDTMLRMARGNEWFFHARDVPGAHVIVKSSDSLPERTVYEAALLAHHFSKNRQRHESVIQYTRVKYVHKKKGLPFGKVIITQEKTLEIDMDKDALKNIITRAH